MRMSKAEAKNNKGPNDKGAGPTRSFDGSVKGPGSQIGPFRIESELGRGAMGVVYLAHDTKLDRQVAIKSLPVEVMENPKVRSRFSREAKVLASLNHPNIATIYEELKEEEGVGYLVLEYVPGQTLAEQIAKGPLKLQEALTIALQIAEAVATAHEHDVIHRDLKPGNIKITPEDKVKVLDFGLAKAVGGEALDEQTTVTEPGRVIGTPAYMSPEQARGKPTDKRSDIWSFGCVLYEMLTATVPFEGETISDTLANILQTEPDWQALPQTTPVNIQTLLRRCLEKDPRRRLRDIGDAVIEIRETLSPPPTAPPATTLPRLEAAPWTKPQTLAIIVVAALVCILGAIVALWNPWRITSPPKSQLGRFIIDLPQGESIGSTIYYEPMAAYGSAVALSPDGRRLAYVVRRGETSHLYLRSFKEFKAQMIPGTEDARMPFFSPDGNWIGFCAGGKLKKVSLLGGAPQTICEVQRAREGCWLEDNTIVFADEHKYGLWQVTASVGEPKRLTTPLKFLKEEQEHSHLYPHILPGGKGVLFTIASPGQSRIAAFSLETGRSKPLIDRGTYAHFVPPGHIVYYLEGDLIAAPFDLRAMEVTGPEVPVVEGVASFGWGGAHFSVSRNGSLVYIPGSAAIETNKRLVRVDRTGKVEALPFPLGDYQSPRIAPDGERLLIVEYEPEPYLWVCELARGAKRRFTDDRGQTYWGIWSPDGKQIVFNSSLGGGGFMDLYSKPADGSTQEKHLTEGTNQLHLLPKSWTDDGKKLVITQAVDPNTGFDIAMLPYETAGKPQPLINTPYNEFHPTISPSGRWLAYSSDESGRAEIYIKPYPGPGGAIPVTTEGGGEPAWDPSEKELYYRNDNGYKLFTVSLITEPVVQVGSPVLLFEGSFMGSSGFWGRNYDISPQGDFFILIEEGEMQPATQINVVFNWSEELKRLVPSEKN
jgi:serine/threonine protein kinase